MDILLVEDDQNSRARIARFLRGLGHRLVECENGEDALKMYRPSFGLVLSGIKMPKMSGVDLLRAITGMPEGRDVDIVLLTGHNDLQLAIEALEAGAYGYLLKPLNNTELAALIERVAEHQSLLRENRILKDPEGFPLPSGPFNLERFINSILIRVLEMHNGNKTRAASYLGISRATLYRRLQTGEKYSPDLKTT